jgi:ABC-type transport system involved in multi-copper enzyme maturation permease subunit
MNRANWKKLVVENPMRIEISRFRRKFLGLSGSGVNRAAFFLLLVCYAGLVLSVMSLQNNISPLALVIFQTFLFCLFATAMLHGSIAGERERRSWDLLMVAPISKAQIIAGKFMGAVAALGISAAAMTIPTAIATYSFDRKDPYSLIVGELVSLSFCLLVCAWAIFISARSKRPFMALGTTIGTLILGLIVFPILVGTIFQGERIANELLNFLNPFNVLSVLTDPPAYVSGGGLLPLSFYGPVHIATYLTLTILFLVYAEKTLSYPENDMRFIPQKQTDAGS